MAAGVLLMNSGSIYICLLGFFMNGIGVGLTLPSINMLVLEMNPLRSASALSILNFFWGIGAILCKPFVDIYSNGNSIFTVTLLLAAPLLIAAGLTVIFGPLGIDLYRQGISIGTSIPRMLLIPYST